MRRRALALLVLAVLSAPSAAAQSVAGELVDGVPYLDLASLAHHLGVVMTAMDDVATWRGAAGVATFFRDSADALIQRPGDAGPADQVLAAPVLLRAGTWLVPLDAAPLLGVDAVVSRSLAGGDGAAGGAEEGAAGGAEQGAGSGASLPVDAAAVGIAVRLVLPDGRELTVELEDPSRPPATDAAGASSMGAAVAPAARGVAWEVSDIGPSVPALRFFAGDAVSLLLVDLDLAPLAFPEWTAVVDAAADEAGADHALLLLVTALEPASWQPSLRFTQDGRVLEARHPYRLRLHLGNAGSVAPGAPVAGVVLLPASFSLYRPLEVAWQGATGVITFRR